MSTCILPSNGEPHCIKDDEFEELHVQTERAIADTASVHLDLDRFKGRVSDEFFGVLGAIGKNGRSIDAIRERLDDMASMLRSISRGVEVGSIRPVQMSLPDWDLDEDTGVRDASEWHGLAIKGEMRAEREANIVTALQVEVASLQAQVKERDRQSMRVQAAAAENRVVGLAKWKIAAGVVVSVLTGGGLVLIERLLSR